MKQLATLLRLPQLIALLLLAMLAHGGKVYAQGDSMEQIPLNGIASFLKLRKEHYIGGLYLETLSQDSGSVFNFSGRKRMDIRITIDRWSPRSFTQKWNQSILINNDQDMQQKFADQIYAFTDMLSDDLVAGDRITIDMVPDSGTTVSLNGVVLMSETDNAFFDLLLNSWIGRRPPSSDFRNDILTLPSDAAAEALIARYSATQPDAARKKAIAKWNKPDSPSPIKQIAEKAAAADKPEPKVAVAQPKAPAVEAPAEQTKAPAAAVKEQDKTELKAVPETVVETAPKAVAATVAAAAPAVSAAPKAAAAPKPAIEKPKAEVAAAKPAPKPEKKVVAKAPAAKQEPVKVALSPAEQQQKKLLRKYQRTVLKLTYLNTQYPKRAMDLNQQGLLRVAVKIDRQGKVLEIVEQVSSKHKLLNKAARDAVNKTAPYPEAPDDLLGDDFEIVLPFNFKL